MGDIIDVNAHLGRWPFQRVKHSDRQSLLGLMDEEGIERALVDSLDAVFLRDPQPGNKGLHATIGAHRDRLVPLACLTPQMHTAGEDLKQCREEYGFAGLRLYPQYHGYELTDQGTLDLARAAAERGMFLSIPMRMEDARFTFGVSHLEPMPMETLVEFLHAVGDATVLVTNLLGAQAKQLADQGLLSVGGRIMIETSETDGGHDPIADLLDSVPAECALLGTHSPLRSARCAILNVQNSDVSDETKRKIMRENALRLIGQAASE